MPKKNAISHHTFMMSAIRVMLCFNCFSIGSDHHAPDHSLYTTWIASGSCAGLSSVTPPDTWRRRRRLFVLLVCWFTVNIIRTYKQVISCDVCMLYLSAHAFTFVFCLHVLRIPSSFRVKDLYVQVYICRFQFIFVCFFSLKTFTNAQYTFP